MSDSIPAHLYSDVMRLVEQGLMPEEAIVRAEQIATRDARRRTPERAPMPPENDNLQAPQPLNEKQFQGMTEQVFRGAGWLVFHAYDSRRSEPGYPDITAVHPERGVIHAELKMPNGRVSDAQQRWIGRLTEAGARVYVWKPEDWAEITRTAEGK